MNQFASSTDVGTRTQQNVTIVVPVYGQVDFVQKVVESVLRFGDLTKNKLIVINDCGPNSEDVRAIVQRAQQRSPHITYAENEKNLGFVQTCNRAVLELDESTNDVLLLNSDAELTQGALQEMQAVLNASPRHACVSPRTNKGTIATFPVFPRRTRTSQESLEFFASHCELLPRYSVTPVSPGFAMLISRRVINAHGLFDEIFSPGYEEENDFCLRVNSLGLSAVIANHAFVFHEGNASFGARRSHIAAKNAQVMETRFPFYPALVQNYLDTRIDPVDKFLDYLDPTESPSILVDCSVLSGHLNGTVKNVLSFLDFVERRASTAPGQPQITLLVTAEMASHYELERRGFKLALAGARSEELFDVGFALSPLWSFEAFARLAGCCARIASLHLDVIALRTWELNGAEPTLEQAVYFAADWANTTIFISDSARSDFSAFRPGAELRDARTIHQGVMPALPLPTAKADPGHFTASFVHSEELAVLVVGNALKHKQVDPTLAAIANQPFEVIALADRNSVSGNVTTVRSGSLSDRAVRRLFDTADVIVFPSAYEGFGLPIAEALEARKPLIVFDTDTAREVVELLGGVQTTLFFDDFSSLPGLITAAATIEVVDYKPVRRSSDAFNSELLDVILDLARKPVDPVFLRHRSAQAAILRRQRVKDGQVATPITVSSVAVVIPFYNGSHYIERAIKSALSQSRRPSEIIIVDDGSSPAEAKKLARIAREYPVIVVTKANGGQGSARNLGIASTEADFVCLLDQDDYFLEWHIEHLVKVAEARGDDRFAFAYGDTWRGDESGTVLHQSWVQQVSVHPKSDLFMQLRNDCFILPSASLIAKQPFLEIGGFDENLRGFEDDDLFTRFFAAGYTSVFDPRPVTFWTINESSTSYSIAFARSRWLYFEKLLNTYQDRPMSNEYIFRNCLRPRFMGEFIHSYFSSCFLQDGYAQENLERLDAFRKYLEADPSCKELRRDRFALFVLVRLSQKNVVRLARFLASRIGGVFFGRLGERSIRPRLRELVRLARQTTPQPHQPAGPSRS